MHDSARLLLSSYSFLSSSYVFLSKGMELVYFQSTALHAGGARANKTDTTPCFHRTFLSIVFSVLSDYFFSASQRKARYRYV